MSDPVVTLDHRPPNIGGRGWRNLRYILKRQEPDGSNLIFGPVVQLHDGRHVADPKRNASYRNVPADTVTEVES